MTTDTNWRDDAACLNADPDLFFPIGTTGPALDQIDQAKRICKACTVRKQCLAWALDLGAAAGIWGGTTEDERPPAIAIAPSRRRFIGNPWPGCADHQDQVTSAHQAGRDDGVRAWRRRRGAGHVTP